MRNLISISGKINVGKDEVGRIIQYLTSAYDAKNNLPYISDKTEDYSIGSKFKIRKFANKLKDIVCILLGCSKQQLEDREFKETELGEEWWYWKPLEQGLPLIPYHSPTYTTPCQLVKTTPRLLLQLLGTQCGRNILHPNIWVNSLFSDYIGGCELQACLGSNYCGGFKAQESCDAIFPNWILTDTRFENESKAIKDRGGLMIKVVRGESSNIGLHESETSLDSYEDWDYIIQNNSTIEHLVEQVREILKKEGVI